MNTDTDNVENVPQSQPPRRRGRPKGSKNKPKVAPNPGPRPILNAEGFPNLPEGKIWGRPVGKKNSGPRKTGTEQETLSSDAIEIPVVDEAWLSFVE